MTIVLRNMLELLFPGFGSSLDSIFLVFFHSSVHTKYFYVDLCTRVQGNLQESDDEKTLT